MDEVRVTEIADGIHQLTTYLDEIDFGLNQYPVTGDEVLEIGGHRMRWIDTPHLPHGWEAGLLYDETTRTLLCGDLFSRSGPYPPTTSDDIAVPGAADDPSYSLTPRAPPSCDASPRSTSQRSRRCTDPPSPEVAERRCTPWRTSSKPASPQPPL